MGQVLAWKSGYKVPLLLLGPSYPLKTLPLSHLVRSGSQLHIKKFFEACQTANLICSWLPHLTQHVKIQKKCDKWLLPSAAV
jgi:hypothetical protein